MILGFFAGYFTLFPFRSPISNYGTPDITPESFGILIASRPESAPTFVVPRPAPPRNRGNIGLTGPPRPLK